MSSKRKHKTLTIKEKNDILCRLNRNESFSSLASEYGVRRSTIYDIKKIGEKIQKFASTSDCRSDRQTLKRAEHPEVEQALYTWFLQERYRNTPISGHTLATKAKYFYNEIKKKDDFVASKGWLERFKRRYRIRLSNVTKKKREKLCNNTICLETFQLRFLQKVKSLDLCPSQVYSVGKSGLFWRLIPSKKRESLDEKYECKVSKEHVTISACSNAAGTHALKMLVIGKSDNLNSLKNIDLPVHYYEQKCAWLTKELFKKWFDECFVPEVRQWLEEHNLPQKALLLLDNASGYTSEEELKTEDKCITVMFLSPNSTALIQPMDNIIQYIKQDYKKNLLLTAISKDQPIEKTLKEFNIEDFAFALCQSRNGISSLTITSSWKNLWPDIVTNPSDTPQISVTSEVIKQVASETYISPEDLEIWFRGTNEEENDFHEVFDEEIPNQAFTSTINEEDEDDKVIPTPQVTTEVAINAFELGLQWAEQNGESHEDLLVLRRLRDKALVSRFNHIKREKID